MTIHAHSVSHRTMVVFIQGLKKMKFEELGVNSEIVRALQEMQISEPTEIQEKAIPLVKAGHDIVGMSKTGSGKTAAFGIPIIENVQRGKGIQVLIMVPTRELAVQVGNELRKFSKYKRCSIVPIYGGVSLSPQMDNLRIADIVVGTPGRLKDHLQRGTIDLSRAACVVLDEADKMVEMGFIEDVEIILEHTSAKKQILLFGATISDEIERLEHRFMNNPVKVQAEAQVEEELLQQYYYSIQPHEKFSLLIHLLRTEKPQRSIIFCSTRSTVELVARNLRTQGIQVEMIHGKLSQNRRLSVINNFHRGQPPLLVASAVAARGLDIKDVTHIFNYDLSKDPQEYVHRIGRTARAGEKGKAITLLSQRDYEPFQNILNRYRVPVEELFAQDFPRVRFDAGRSRFSGGYGGRFARPRSGFQGRREGYGGEQSGYGGQRNSYSRGPRRFGNGQGWRARGY